ncbi:Coenzyme F420 hydrogenase/dehydrogenase, beta subunit C-terminal domain [uncultured Bacteroides sp.]|uniref:Coenzyme F420 hydrogenase/dehydrogenase, beta subunit C-terminal domain n=1 Tax=uncultured Bacteroides sp. TaxID=162156 RepID=UPI0026769C58|nr:Coenzyme F420 hydrogenase/dehydrogenase, beta subunit C-terminal domain [uncultured Bacteroides sp.]
MIHITDKSECCGCTACANRCSHQCISLHEDNEGFLYPHVCPDECIDCGQCEEVCPVLRQNGRRIPLKIYAARNRDEEILRESSSGGIFTLLAEKIISDGGVVFGARFDANWEVIHDYTETIDGLAVFRGSKYLQSRLGNTYVKVREFLRAGRQVLFSGTPCQVAGLKTFLKKEYAKLLTVDFVCHGVPSPMVWRQYLKESVACLSRKKNAVLSHSVKREDLEVVESILFRDKKNGWKRYCFTFMFSVSAEHKSRKRLLLSEPFSENPFMQAFLSNLILRPSCYACPVKNGKSGSDLTIGDFWGADDIFPEYVDDKGVSLVMPMSSKGKLFFEELSCSCLESTYKEAQAANPCILNVVDKPVYRDFFFHRFRRKKNFMQTFDDCRSTVFYKRMFRFLYRKAGI